MKWPFRRKRPISCRGEDLAARYLRRNGYTILERNAQFGRYEIDIIAQERDTIAFVEVKTRRDDEVAAPEDSVGSMKRRHIRAAAHRYIDRRNDPRLYYRFDIVAVLLPERGKPVVTLFRDAFRDE